MHVDSTRIHFFSHRPLSVLSKSTIAGLFGSAVFVMLLWHVVRAVPFFLTLTAIMFICTVFILTGIRWIPFVSSFICSLFLYYMLIPTPFALAHFAHPKGNGSNPWLSFWFFVIVTGTVWFMTMTIAIGISAGIQNYRQRKQQTTPRWFLPILTGMIGLFLGVLLIGAIVQPSSAIATPSHTVASQASTNATRDANGNTVVHMGTVNFAQSAVTVTKGKKLKLIDDGSFEHILSTGSWVNRQPVLLQQAGEPAVHNVDLKNTGASVEIGPFTTAGTYHVLCTLHVSMTLTIIVQ